MHIVIIGGGVVGQTLAERLDTAYNEIQFIDEDEHVIEQATERGVASIAVDDIREDVSIDIMDVSLTTIIVVATARDRVNLLLAQQTRQRFDVGQIIVRVNEAQNHAVFAELGLDTVHATPVLAEALADAVRDAPASNMDAKNRSQVDWV